MTETQFAYLLKHIEPVIRKRDINMRKAISVKTKLQVTVRYLAAGVLVLFYINPKIEEYRYH